MRVRLALVAGTLLFTIQGRPPDIAFATHAIDPGASETAAVADINRDGRLDIVSGEYWYQAPSWTKRKFREVGFSNNYIDSFSVMPVDVDADGYPDIVDVSWFARKIAWWKNPGRAVTGAALWQEADINTGGNVEFAVLADVDNDGRALEIVAQQNGTPQAWFEVRNGAWVKHVVSDRTYGHGIGVGDVNGDKRNDILTPRGWLEAPADPRSGPWTYHAAWESINAPIRPAGAGAAAPPAAGRAAGRAPTSHGTGFHSRARRQRRRKERRRHRRRSRLRRVLVRAGRRTASGHAGPSTTRGRRATRPRSPISTATARRSRDRQALHGAQRLRSRREGAARRVLVRIQRPPRARGQGRAAGRSNGSVI